MTSQPSAAGSLTDLPRFTGSLDELRHSATALGVAAWRIRQTAEELAGARGSLGGELHDATAEVRAALLEFVATAQALLARLHHQRALASRLPPDGPCPGPSSGSSAEPGTAEREDLVREAVAEIVGEFQAAEEIAAARIRAVSQGPLPAAD